MTRQPRLIKKYPNRRLYDTVEGRYITLEDVQQLILQRERIYVQDRKAGEDITAEILLQLFVLRTQISGGAVALEILYKLARGEDTLVPGFPVDSRRSPEVARKREARVSS